MAATKTKTARVTGATKAAPAKTAPAKTAPAKTAPAKTAPAKTAPAKTAPAKTAPAKATGKAASSKAPAAKGAPSAAPSNKSSVKADPQGAPRASKAPPPADRKSRLPPKLTVRQPADADERKAKIAALAVAVNQIKALKRTLNKSFMDVGAILIDVRTRDLASVKGMSFESFLERETDLGKVTALRIVRAVELLQKPAAVQGGLERAIAAVRAFDGDTDAASTSLPTTSPGLVRSPIPFHKR